VFLTRSRLSCLKLDHKKIDIVVDEVVRLQEEDPGLVLAIKSDRIQTMKPAGVQPAAAMTQLIAALGTYARRVVEFPDLFQRLHVAPGSLLSTGGLLSGDACFLLWLHRRKANMKP
jgi:hypothetical protein